MVEFNVIKSIIAQNEGLKKSVYLDSKGIPTVGIGLNLNDLSNIKYLNDLHVDVDALRAGKISLSTAQIDQIFAKSYEIAKKDAENFINKGAKNPKFWDTLSEARQTVLVDMAFNLGESKLNQFNDLRTAIQNGDYIAATAAMEKSGWYNQVPNRAKRDMAAMASDKIGYMFEGKDGLFVPQCFAAGTPITLADGTQKPIEHITPGDNVAAFDGFNALQSRKVVRLLRNTTDRWIEITTPEGAQIKATPSHRVLTPQGDFYNLRTQSEKKLANRKNCVTKAA